MEHYKGSGAGKSTFAKTLCGHLKPVSGEIAPAKEKERLKQCFMVMQDVNYQLFSDIEAGNLFAEALL